jgi:15-cis-phytoene synthase
MSINLFHKTSDDINRRIALNYSTSFSLGIKMLATRYRAAIFNIYGLVRVADEIVDTFHEFDKETLLKEFKADTYKAIELGISTNPVLHGFQRTAREFQIGHDLIEPFFKSMAEDLETHEHDITSYKEYIYGSAEVVGLMCLRVFCNGNNVEYEKLVPYARSLGAAFQKVNFLRDIKSDIEDRGRTYFPNVDFNAFSEEDKVIIIKDIKVDFEHALIGINLLPKGCRTGVHTAYTYYLKLLQKIERTQAPKVMETRIRIPNYTKMLLLAKSYVS